jgi:transposase
MQESFQRFLEQYEFLSEQIGKQTELLRELSQTVLYRERVEILRSVPGIGLIAAMEFWKWRSKSEESGGRRV